MMYTAAALAMVLPLLDLHCGNKQCDLEKMSEQNTAFEGQNTIMKKEVATLKKEVKTLSTSNPATNADMKKVLNEIDQTAASGSNTIYTRVQKIKEQMEDGTTDSVAKRVKQLHAHKDKIENLPDNTINELNAIDNAISTIDGELDVNGISGAIGQKVKQLHDALTTTGVATTNVHDMVKALYGELTTTSGTTTNTNVFEMVKALHDHESKIENLPDNTDNAISTMSDKVDKLLEKYVWKITIRIKDKTIKQATSPAASCESKAPINIGDFIVCQDGTDLFTAKVKTSVITHANYVDTCINESKQALDMVMVNKIQKMSTFDGDDLGSSDANIENIGTKAEDDVSVWTNIACIP